MAGAGTDRAMTRWGDVRRGAGGTVVSAGGESWLASGAALGRPVDCRAWNWSGTPRTVRGPGGTRRGRQVEGCRGPRGPAAWLRADGRGRPRTGRHAPGRGAPRRAAARRGGRADRGRRCAPVQRRACRAGERGHPARARTRAPSWSRTDTPHPPRRIRATVAAWTWSSWRRWSDSRREVCGPTSSCSSTCPSRPGLPAARPGYSARPASRSTLTATSTSGSARATWRWPAADPERWRILDGTRSESDVARAVIDHVERLVAASEPFVAPARTTGMSEPTGGSLPSTPAGSASASDEDLLRAAARGDQESIAHLFDRHQGSMYGLALRITNDPMLAQDVVQEAFLGVWRNAARFDGAKASGRTWMMSITHHRAIDAIRRRRPTVELPEPEMPPPAALTMPDIWDEVSGRLDASTIRVGACPPVGRPAAGDRAGLLRRSDAAGDRGADERAAGHGQEPCPPGTPCAARRAGPGCAPEAFATEVID